MRGAVVMASWNDDRAIGPVLAEIGEAARALAPSEIDLHVVLADNASTDATVEVAVRTAAQIGLPLTVLTLDAATLDAAFVAGMGHAIDHESVEFVVTLDADGQHDGRQIPDLVRAFLARGSGMTIGSRWARGGSSPGNDRTRAVASRVANLTARLVTGAGGVADTTTSFRVHDREVAELIRTDAKAISGHGFFSAAVAITQAHGFSVDEVPIIFRPRYSGVAKLNRNDVRVFAGNLGAARRLVKEARRSMRSNQALWASRSAAFRNQHPTENSQFAAIDELTNLTGAERFTTWIADQISPHCGEATVEVGAGLGAIASKLAAADERRTVTALEPAENLFQGLCDNLRPNPNAVPMCCTSEALLGDGGAGRYDSVVYVSVLEHIRDDVNELQVAHDLLAPGGSLAIFVPAMPALYGTLDFKSGHFRRYDREMLDGVIRAAGFEVESLRYLDVAGVLPYWLMYRLFKRQSLDQASAGLFDRVIVPLSKVAQRVAPNPPLGKNLLAIARRPR